MFDYLHSPIYFFAVSTLILALILTLFYIRHNYKASLPQKLLALVFLCMLYLFGVQFLIVFNFIYKYPHFFRTGALSSIIFIPIMFLIAQFEVGRKKFNWKDLFHFAPAVFYVINFFPFFVKSVKEKQQIIYQIDQDNILYIFNEGFLVSDKVVQAFRILQVLIYIILLLLITQKNWIQLKQRVLLKSVIFAFIIYLSINFLIGFYWVFAKENADAVVIAFMSNTLLFYLFFFFHPALLLPSAQDNFEQKIEKPNESVVNNLENEFVPAINFSTNYKTQMGKKEQGGSRNRVRIGKIERYFKENLPYLDQDFSLKKATNKLGISSKLVSQSIKLKYGLNFNSYTNGLRIAYALQKIHTDKTWRNLSVQQMATAVGFSSANLFYKYFSEKTGNTPREYIQKLEDEMFFNET